MNMDVVVLEEPEPFAELIAAVNDWADAIKELGEAVDEVLRDLDWVQWLQIVVFLIGIAGSIGVLVLSCFPSEFAFLSSTDYAAKGCCGGNATEIALAFDPISWLAVPMVNCAAHLTRVLAEYVREHGEEDIIFALDHYEDISDAITGWC